MVLADCDCPGQTDSAIPRIVNEIVNGGCDACPF